MALLKPQTSTGTIARLRYRIVQLARAMPIRWRIVAIAVLNSAVVLVLAIMIWSGARVLGTAWDDVRQVRQSEAVLNELESETSQLQNLIHRYINQPSPELFGEILLLRTSVQTILANGAAKDPALAGSAPQLQQITERFLNGFGDLRKVQTAIAETYETQVLGPAKTMAALYSTIEDAGSRGDSQIRQELAQSRETFTAMLLAANAYYFSLATAAAEEARTHTETLEKTIPRLSQLAENDAQREAIRHLQDQTATLRNGLIRLSDEFSRRTALLHNVIDASQAEAMTVIGSLSNQMAQRENQAQTTFDRTLKNISQRVLSIAAILLAIIITASIITALSIRLPMRQLMTAMRSIMAGEFDRKVSGIRATDEIGAMARAVEIFRENAVARRKAEDELRAAKESSEQALVDLRSAQQDLIDADRLAALGRLVAGVAHEVNNPIGISLTVASSFSRRSEQFEAALKSGQPLRKSQLEEFLKTCRDAAQQLVANLHRAGDLVQSFKQVAVDRSQGEMRKFDLSEATEQIVISLRPALKQSPIEVELDIASDLTVTTYAGSYGQVLTNLFLNATSHAFPDGRPGRITIVARAKGEDIEIVFSDNGVGMTPDVQRRAFDPFFTTRRGEGGTGLGLHIVYNLITQQLGGRMTLESNPGQGTTFHIIMPRAVPREPASMPANKVPASTMPTSEPQ